ncbi:unnamed protein product, partial [Laminaria digitata]
GAGGVSGKGKAAAAAMRLKAGAEVYSCFRTGGKGVWYRGRVTTCHRSGSADVRYEDGEVRRKVPRKHLTTFLPPAVVQAAQLESATAGHSKKKGFGGRGCGGVIWTPGSGVGGGGIKRETR